MTSAKCPAKLTDLELKMSKTSSFSRSFSIFVELTSIFIAFGTIVSAMIHSYIFSYNGFRYLSIATISDIFRDGISFAVNMLSVIFVVSCAVLSIFVKIVSSNMTSKARVLINLIAMAFSIYFVLFIAFILHTSFIETNYDIWFRYYVMFSPLVVFSLFTILTTICLFLQNNLLIYINGHRNLIYLIVCLCATASVFISFIDIQNRFEDGAEEDSSRSDINRNVAGVTNRGKAAEACKDNTIGRFFGSEPLFFQAELLWVGEKSAIVQCKDFYKSREGSSPNMFRKILIINSDQLIF